MSKKTVQRECKHCSKLFEALFHNVKKGFGNYCSKACSNSANPRGFTKGHGSYWTEESRKKFRESMSGDKHFAWKGDDASKVAKHTFINGIKGRPKECEHCGIKDPNKVYDWANVDHQYSRDPDDYIRLCRSCHRIYDYQNNKELA